MLAAIEKGLMSLSLTVTPRALPPSIILVFSGYNKSNKSMLSGHISGTQEALLIKLDQLVGRITYFLRKY